MSGSFPALVVLAATLTLGVLQSVASRFLYGLGRLRLYSRVALLEAAANVALTAALIGPFGVIGVAVAVAVPNVVCCVVILVHAAKQLDVTGRQYVTACLQPLALSLIPLAVWLGVGESPAEWGPIFALGAAGVAPYLLAVVGVEWLLKILHRQQGHCPHEQEEADEEHGVRHARPCVGLGR